MPSRLRIQSSQTVYKGRIVRLKPDRVVESRGVTAQREASVAPPFIGAACALAAAKQQEAAEFEMRKLFATRWELPCSLRR